jgi:hypothetical protein
VAERDGTDLPFDQKIVHLADALEPTIAHAFGGAIALAYYAEPRATHDIDLNVFVPSDEAGGLLAIVAQLGVTVTDDVPARIAHDGQIRLSWGDTPLDVFFAYDPFHDACAARRRRVPFGRDDLWILAPEDLVICKATFDRRKDWLDIEQVLLTTGGDLDTTDIRAWLHRLLGPTDRRVEHFDQTLASILGGPAVG